MRQQLSDDLDQVTGHKPGLNSLLGAMGLDVEFHRADGDQVFYRDQSGADVAVLDFVGGYGSLLLGHQHPELIAAASNFLCSGRPNHVQGSLRSGSLKLAQQLSARVGDDFCCVFANSGAEAVEAAIKHATLETGGRTLIALEGGFHGKTTGALELTANPQYREPFGTAGRNVARVRPNDCDHLRQVFNDVRDPSGFVFEPVQGEAGVRPLTGEFVQQAAALCAARAVPLIADECQTGLGRTGSFLASHALGVHPDYIILAKALGGGLTKISALLVRHDRYQARFDLLHSSTFADDEFSAAIALRVLELIDTAAIQRCCANGEELLRCLERVRERHPGVIKQVRGMGLMLGVEFQRPRTDDGFLMNFLVQRKLLGPLLAGYLLREQRIRIAPTLSDPLTLRVQPSIGMSRAGFDRLAEALEDVCSKLGNNDVVGLTRFLARSTPTAKAVIRATLCDTSADPVRLTPADAQGRPATRVRCRRAAWLFHFIDENDLVHLEPAFAALTQNERGAFLERAAAVTEPVVLEPVDIHSHMGTIVQLCPIALPVTSAWLLERRSGPQHHAAHSLIQSGVDVAARLECQVVTLGQFTSTLTGGGRCLDNRKRCLTSGNSYTAALVAQSIERALLERGLDRRELTLAIVGAAGDIGQTCALMLAEKFRRSILVGSRNRGSHRRLARLARMVPGSEPATGFADVRCADVVICATNCLTTPLGPEHLHPQAIVCDVSVPSTLSPWVAEQMPGVTLLPGATVELPGREDLRIPGFPLPAGRTYGCMAEGLLLALEQIGPDQWQGPSLSAQAERTAELAQRHGFQLAEGPLPMLAQEAICPL